MKHSKTYYRVRTAVRATLLISLILSPFIITGLIWPGHLN